MISGSDIFSFGNAAGMARTMEHVDALLRTPATDITIGSARRQKHDGNSGTTYFFNKETKESGNALGVPDAIAEKGYAILLPQMAEKTRAASKVLRFSAHAATADEFAYLTSFAFSYGADEVELNLSCPNERRKDEKKIIPSYDPALTRRILGRVALYASGKKVAVKVSPVGDDLIPELAKEFVRSGIVSHVVGVNTIPNQTFTNPDGTQGLDYIGEDGSRYHTGGRAGAPIKDERRRVQAAFKKVLPTNIGFIAVGGIWTAEDVLESYREGAYCAQCATALLETPPYGRIFHEWAQGF